LKKEKIVAKAPQKLKPSEAIRGYFCIFSRAFASAKKQSQTPKLLKSKTKRFNQTQSAFTLRTKLAFPLFEEKKTAK
jgi:hypothetical protein